MTNSFILCPNNTCQGKIPVSLELMLQGHKFVCPDCNCEVSLSVGSIPTVQTALDQYNQLMQQKKISSEDSSFILK